MDQRFDTLIDDVYAIKLNRCPQFVVKGSFLTPEETYRLNPPKSESEG